ncbi:hypothetical protein M3Y98_01133700 [Aphelenchoides besseyi]|nr:hypothetical protein M3Y98_01133700 [Aphelenchoides besseyi]
MSIQSKTDDELRADRRKKIILPCVIPMHHKKNSGGFSRIRDVKINIQSSSAIVETHAVPFHICPPLKKSYASQSGSKPFGSFRDQLTYVRENEDEEPKRIHELVVDKKATERVNPRWANSNPDATNEQIGQIRPTISRPIGGRRFTFEEQLKCRAELPRFQCMKETAAARDAQVNGSQPMASGLHIHRQTITPISGLDRTEQDQLDSNRYMAWLGGQLTLQSQSQTGGFHRQRDVASSTYYNKVANQSTVQNAEERKADREKRLAALNEIDDLEQNFATDSVTETIQLPTKNIEETNSDEEESEIEDEEEV